MNDNVIKLPLERRRLSKMEAKMVQVSDELDAIILKHLADPNLELKMLAGILAHRLGALLSRIDRKQELWDVCVKVVRTQAKVR